MADTINNVRLPADTWVNLYESSGIDVGKQVQVQNVSQTRVRLHTGATAPTETSGFNIIPPNSAPYLNQETSSGEWALSEIADGFVNVGEAS